ncbi:PREDICTED: uncharacterized protein LOC106741876 [Dinoponera quadriceps]|uniref:Uncharacterized protein LOC106741876 n=1 Tax=Dinoponera quadriceps TaxID=609295 RepID=A0A6P3WV64_DINQU|nr:PREDICTED: uncharacterized protein LOC106741876 [Dinoponera quadriceps]
MTTSFATYYFILLGFGVAALLNAAILLDNPLELTTFVALMFVELYYIFLGNYVGQDVIDISAGICQITYSTQWYAAPLWVQKSLLLVMLRSGRNSALTAGGLFQASLEGFAMLMSASISYVMLLLSMRGQQSKLGGEPNFLNVVAPLNKSRRAELLFRVEYFVDQEEYYHIIQLHLDVGLMVAATTILAAESFCLTMQKLILFLIQKTTKAYKVDCIGMFYPSLEGLASDSLFHIIAQFQSTEGSAVNLLFRRYTIMILTRVV